MCIRYKEGVLGQQRLDVQIYTKVAIGKVREVHRETLSSGLDS